MATLLSYDSVHDVTWPMEGPGEVQGGDGGGISVGRRNSLSRRGRLSDFGEVLASRSLRYADREDLAERWKEVRREKNPAESSPMYFIGEEEYDYSQLIDRGINRRSIHQGPSILHFSGSRAMEGARG